MNRDVAGLAATAAIVALLRDLAVIAIAILIAIDVL